MHNVPSFVADHAWLWAAGIALAVFLEFKVNSVVLVFATDAAAMILTTLLVMSLILIVMGY